MEDGFSLLDYGYNFHPKNILVAGNENEMIKVPIVGIIIKYRDLKILFDTGPDARKKYPIMKDLNTTQKEENLLPNQLKLLNLNIKDIDLAIISHLHYDHAGFLGALKGVPIIIQKDELRYAYYPDWFYKDVYHREDFDFPDLDYNMISGDYKITDEIRIISLPGHTPGTQGLEIDTNEKSVIFVSDAIYTLENIFPTKKKQGFDWSTALWGESADKVKLLSIIKKAEVFPGHDVQFYSKKEYAPYVYRINW
ncbi:hypothetical protein CM19_01560 [Candidatus Acidianus copahuensis]|uniref:Metallo-beta-lactamase domain-containing protein n=1 Tax=Candidatus Acidianus copahuensis TaxID=1160895 RepID=A0A031LUJ7_9CREN|nr:N-acyl homoserine lactonase family protein [Candidatus Acidianus copahuensis]EZQ11445.1 hypothetical protein CM19_01560 [Candidatus Acidianus copahuensis]